MTSPDPAPDADKLLLLPPPAPRVDPTAVRNDHNARQALDPADPRVADHSYTHLATLPLTLPVLRDARVARQVTHLSLSDNRLKRLPAAALRRLPVLEVLLLRYNRLTSLPSDIGRLRNLQFLRLENNLLESLPDAIGQLTQLRVLQVGANRLRQLPDSLGELASLEALYVYGNRLRRLPDSVGRLTRLVLLYADNNELDALPPLGALARLAELDVAHNRLRSLPATIGACANLQVLYLQHNELDHLPPQIGRLPRLHTLDVRHNRLSALPAEVTTLQCLHNIFFSDNPLRWDDGGRGRTAEPDRVQRWPPSLQEIAGRLMLQQRVPIEDTLPRTLARSLKASRAHECFVCHAPYWREATVAVRLAALPSCVPVVYRLCDPAHLADVPGTASV